MFKVKAGSLTEYFKAAGQREGCLRKTDKLIRQTSPNLKRWLYDVGEKEEHGMHMKMIGYGKFTYSLKSGVRLDFPIIGLALQKNYISIYVSVTKNGSPIVKDYCGKLNEVRIGKKDNFSFTSFEVLHKPNFVQLIKEISWIAEQDSQNAIDYKESQRRKTAVVTI